jgi:peptidoglycan hydrolase CwlO-like protein
LDSLTDQLSRLNQDSEDQKKYNDSYNEQMRHANDMIKKQNEDLEQKNQSLTDHFDKMAKMMNS